jgi:hypothetical protein
MAMMDKLKDKLPGKKEDMPKPSGIEIEIGEEEEEEAPEMEGEEEEVSVGKLAEFSDEELMAEMKKRGMEVASGGASITALPEAEPEEEEEVPAVPAKKKPMV